MYASIQVIRYRWMDPSNTKWTADEMILYILEFAGLQEKPLIKFSCKLLLLLLTLFILHWCYLLPVPWLLYKPHSSPCIFFVLNIHRLNIKLTKFKWRINQMEQSINNLFMNCLWMTYSTELNSTINKQYSCNCK